MRTHYAWRRWLLTAAGRMVWMLDFLLAHESEEGP